MSAQQSQLDVRVVNTNPTSHAPRLQGHESDAVRKYLLLELVLLIIDHDIKVIGSSKFKLPRLYETALRGVQDRVLLDMANLRRMFRDHGIKMVERTKLSEGLLVKFVCRGYHHEKMLLWSVVKVECEDVLKQYLSQ